MFELGPRKLNNTHRLGYADFPVEASLAILDSDASTQEKREAMSSLGRRRDPNLKPILCKYIGDKNPEIAMQAIRALLVFKSDPAVMSILEPLCHHPNEMIRDVVQIEINGTKEHEERNHISSPDFMKNTVVHGDVLETLKSVPDRSIHLTFTSPPYYNARDYSKYRSYQEYLDFLEHTFSEIHRVTKEGRFFLLNTSPVIIPRAGRKYSSRRYPVPYDIHGRLDNIGWEFIDDIVWAKPEKSAKNRVAGFDMHRKPLTYKTNARTECVMVYRRKSHKLIDWNLRQYPRSIIEQSKVHTEFERSNVWNIPPATDRVHSAVFPIRLCDQVVRLYSFVGDLVFDPFAGSGTFGKSAIENKRFCFLTELSETYIARIQQNIGATMVHPEHPIRVLSNSQFREESTRCP